MKFKLLIYQEEIIMNETKKEPCVIDTAAPLTTMDNDLNAITSTHINVGVNFALLNTYLMAVLEKDENGVELLVKPQVQYKSQPFTLTELIDGINELFKGLTGGSEFNLSAETIFNQIKQFLKGSGLDTMTIAIRQVFLHLKKPAKGKLQFEYAFSISITMSEDIDLTDFTLASLQSLSFGIWNTDNKRILSNMGLLSIAAQLA